MRTAFASVAALLLAVILAAPVATAQKPSTAHVDLMRIWRQGAGTPEKMGLLPLAEAEAKTALLAINKAVDAEDGAALSANVSDAIHAIDPARVETGPGHGFGLMRAAAAIIAHMRVAQQRSDASENVRHYGDAVIAGADHIVLLSQEALKLCRKVQDASATQSREMLKTARDKLSTAMVGKDDNGDGEISGAEAGLKQLRETMARLMQAEGF